MLISYPTCIEPANCISKISSNLFIDDLAYRIAHVRAFAKKRPDANEI